MENGSVGGRKSVSDLIAFYNKEAEKGKEPSKIGRSASAPPKVSADTQKTEKLALERKMPSLEEKPVKWNSKLPSSSSRKGPEMGARKAPENPNDRTRMAMQARMQQSQPQIFKAGPAKAEVPQSKEEAKPITLKAEIKDVPQSIVEASPAEEFKETEAKPPEAPRAWTKAEIPRQERRVVITHTPAAAVPERKATIALPNPEVAAKVETTSQTVLSPGRRPTQTRLSTEQQKTVLNDLSKAVASLKANPTLKIQVQKNNAGGYEITTRPREKRGLFGSFGKSEGTIATKDLLIQLASSVSASDDPRLASDYHNLLEDFLENTQWGKEFGGKFSDVAKLGLVVSGIYAPSKEDVKAIRDSVKTIRNPNATKEELKAASDLLTNLAAPGKPRVEEFYKSLAKEGITRIDTIEMNEILAGKITVATHLNSAVSGIISDKEIAAAVKDAVGTIQNPEATKEELATASEMLEKLTVPDKPHVEKFYKSLAKEGRDRIDTIEMKEILLGQKEDGKRDLLLTAAGWTVPASKMIKIMDAAIQETVKGKESSQENYSKSLTMLLDASIRLSELPESYLGSPITDSLANRLFQVGQLASQSEAHQAPGMVLEERIQNINAKEIPSSPVTLQEGQNAVDPTSALRDIAKNPNATVDVKDPKTGEVSPKPLREVFIERMAADFRSQSSALFAAIDQKEFRNLAWSKDELKKGYAPNIGNLSRNFNETSNQIQASILSPEIVETKEQAGALIEVYIDLLDACIKDNNYHAAMSINSALNASPINRLITSNNGPTGLVSPNYLGKKAALESILAPSGSYKAYRAALSDSLEKQKAPIPFLGPHQTDLTFINDGNPSVTSDGRTNLNKQALFETQLNILRQAKEQIEGKPRAEESQTRFFTGFQPVLQESKEGEKAPDFDNIAYARSLSLLPRATAT